MGSWVTLESQTLALDAVSVTMWWSTVSKVSFLLDELYFKEIKYVLGL